MSSILAIKINGRESKAPHLQEILTKYGCNIKTRVGFHETSEDNCSMDGFIILHLFGKDKEFQDLFSEIKELNGVTPKFVEFWYIYLLEWVKKDKITPLDTIKRCNFIYLKNDCNYMESHIKLYISVWDKIIGGLKWNLKTF